MCMWGQARSSPPSGSGCCCTDPPALSLADSMLHTGTSRACFPSAMKCESPMMAVFQSEINNTGYRWVRAGLLQVASGVTWGGGCRWVGNKREWRYLLEQGRGVRPSSTLTVFPLPSSHSLPRIPPRPRHSLRAPSPSSHSLTPLPSNSRWPSS